MKVETIIINRMFIRLRPLNYNLPKISLSAKRI